MDIVNENVKPKAMFINHWRKDCGSEEFINLISSESNEVCNREDKRTIAPEHVLKALEVLGFGEYIEEVYTAYEQHRLETMDTMRSGKCSNIAEMTEEEAMAEQQRMFAEARARMNGGASAPKPSDPQTQPNSNS
ncbi:Down-regulator of transcription 1 [Castilleja foliolosa]|uniref:Down-regulator of transcription 1 n=1 Tax=Castilleja foliolosa TaxID=1961234 RepID=A0ABD3C3M5_9LAMI